MAKNFKQRCPNCGRLVDRLLSDKNNLLNGGILNSCDICLITTKDKQESYGNNNVRSIISNAFINNKRITIDTMSKMLVNAEVVKLTTTMVWVRKQDELHCCNTIKFKDIVNCKIED